MGMKITAYLFVFGLMLVCSEATPLSGVSVDVKEVNNVLSRGKRGTDFLTLHEECVVEGCTVEEILEHEDINEECVVEGCNSEEISEYPESLQVHIKRVAEATPDDSDSDETEFSGYDEV